MRILVTGHVGFIGSHFVKHALEQSRDVQVIGFSRLSDERNQERLSTSILHHDRLKSVWGDLTDSNAVSGIFLHREILNGIAETYGWPEYLLAPKRLRHLTAEDRQRYVGAYKIVSGIEMPLLRVWEDDGKLFNAIDGMRFGVQETYCDADGVLFNQTGPFETRVSFGPDGRAHELVVGEGDVTVLRAVRVEDESTE